MSLIKKQPTPKPSQITFWRTLSLMLQEGLQYFKKYLSLTKLIPSPYWEQRFQQYGLLMRVDKPIGTLLLLWPTLWFEGGRSGAPDRRCHRGSGHDPCAQASAQGVFEGHAPAHRLGPGADQRS